MLNKTFLIGILIGVTISTIFWWYARAFWFSIAMYIKDDVWISYREKLWYYSMIYYEGEKTLCYSDGREKTCIPLMDS